MQNEESPGTLQIGEVHPAAHCAMAYMTAFLTEHPEKAMRLIEAFSSIALSGGRLAEVCAETLRRLIKSELVSDRYLLGLAWTIKEMEEHEKPQTKEDMINEL